MYLRNTLVWQAVASMAISLLWAAGAQLAVINASFTFLFFVAVGLASLATVATAAALGGEVRVFTGICFALAAVVGGALKQPGIILAAAGWYAAWTRANFVYEKTSGDTRLLLAFLVSFPVAALYVLIEPVTYGFLKEHGLNGLAERPWVAAIPSLALFAVQALTVAGRRERTA